jgi:periodic tryptophan protein 2
LRGIQKGLTLVQESIVKLSDDNSFTLQFLLDQQQRKVDQEQRQQEEEEEEKTKKLERQVVKGGRNMEIEL